MDRITYHFIESKEIYGSHRIQKALEREGVFYCRSYVALLMKEMGLRSVLKKPFVVTTDSKYDCPIAESFFKSIKYEWLYRFNYMS